MNLTYGNYTEAHYVHVHTQCRKNEQAEKIGKRLGHGIYIYKHNCRVIRIE